MQSHGEKERYIILDLLRGLAVFLMILAHSVYFIHNATNPLLTFSEKIGNTLAFTIFLTVSGATTYLAYLNKDVFNAARAKKRFWVLLLSFFGLAFFIGYEKITGEFGLAKIWSFLDILTLRNLPSYTEFLPPFFIYLLLIISFPDFFRKLAKKIHYAVLFSALAYFLGMLIYQLPVFEFLIPWKALLAGAEGFFRFPILQYFPLFVLGLFWGNWLEKVKSVKHQKEFSEGVAAASVLGFLSAASLAFFIPNLKESLLLRWPPSIPFLLIGLAVGFGFAVVFYLSKFLNRLHLIRDFLLVLGQNALALVVTHILFLSIFSFAGVKSSSLFIFGIMFLTTMVSSLALSTFIPFNFKFQLNFQNSGHLEEKLSHDPLIELGQEIYKEIGAEVTKTEKFFFINNKAERGQQRLVKKRHILGTTVVLVLVLIAAFPPVFEELAVKGNQEIAWWNNEFAYRQPILVKNLEPLSDIPKNEVLTIPVDLNDLANNNKAQKNGLDLVVVYQNAGRFSVLPQSLDESKQIITFQTKEKIGSGQESKNLYLYYGNFLYERTETELNQTWKQRYSTSLEEEESYPYLLTLDHQWNLLGSSKKNPKRGWHQPENPQYSS